MTFQDIPPLRTVCALFLLAFLPLIYLDQHYQIIHHLIRAIGFSIAVGMLVAFGGAVIKLIPRKRLSQGEGLALGICLLWLGIAGHMLVNAVAQFTAHPAAIVHGLMGTFSLWVALSGSLVMFMSSEGIDHAVSVRGAWTVGLFVAAGVFLALVITFGLRIDQWWTSSPYWAEGHDHWLLPFKED